MNRPVDFIFNTDTAQDNEFMKKLEMSEKSITEQALKEFDLCVEACRNVGIEVIVFDKSQYRDLNAEKHPDGVFPNNWFATEPSGQVILFPMRNATRSIEKHAIPFYIELLNTKQFYL